MAWKASSINVSTSIQQGEFLILALDKAKEHACLTKVNQITQATQAHVSRTLFYYDDGPLALSPIPYLGVELNHTAYQQL